MWICRVRPAINLARPTGLIAFTHSKVRYPTAVVDKIRSLNYIKDAKCESRTVAPYPSQFLRVAPWRGFAPRAVETEQIPLYDDAYTTIAQGLCHIYRMFPALQTV